MNQIGMTRRGFLGRLAALGAAVAVGALEALPETPKYLVGIDPAHKLDHAGFVVVNRITGDWSKYTPPIIVEARNIKDDTRAFVMELQERAIRKLHESVRNSVLYGSDRSLWPPEEDWEPLRPEVDFKIRSLVRGLS